MELLLLLIVSNALAGPYKIHEIGPIECATLTDDKWISTQLSKSDSALQEATSEMIRVCAQSFEGSENECRMHAACARGKVAAFVCAANDKSGRSYREWAVPSQKEYAQKLVSARCLAFAETDADREECARSSLVNCNSVVRESTNKAPFEEKPVYEEEKHKDSRATLYLCRTSLGPDGVSSGYYENKKNTDFFKDVAVRRCLLRLADPTQSWQECASKLECYAH